MVALRIQCILAIGNMAPSGIGQKFMLRLIRPVVVLLRMFEIFTNHFLQKDNISFRGADRFTKLMKNKASVARRETLMDIDREYAQFLHVE